MANETIIFSMSELFIRVAGRRMTALPEVGTIASMERINPRAIMTSGLFGTVAFSIVKSNARRLTINVMPQSFDDSFITTGADLFADTLRLLTTSVVYQGTEYISGSAILTNDPVRNWNTDSTEPLPFVFEGVFTKSIVAPFIAPPALTEDEITAAMP